MRIEPTCRRLRRHIRFAVLSRLPNNANYLKFTLYLEGLFGLIVLIARFYQLTSPANPS
jgi:hypothetical protein